MLYIILVLVTLLYSSNSKIYDRCTLATDLLHVHHLPSEQIPTWICIASTGSQFDTSYNNETTSSHGLFQIPKDLWCGNATTGCSLPCSKFRDDEVEDDVECAKKIYKNSGFGGWYAYYQYCKGNQEKFIRGCNF